MVVADKKALRALDKCASRVSKYKHPPIKLTNQVAPSRNGAYRDPASNKSRVVLASLVICMGTDSISGQKTIIQTKE